jgi:HPt (histidine-containing phosphotransfer) domain-containing protein
MDDFLSKPFQRSELVAALRRNLRVAALRPVWAPTTESVTSLVPIRAWMLATVPVVAPQPVVARQPAALAAAVLASAPAADILDRRVLDRIRAIQRPGQPDLVARVLQMYLERSPAQIRAIAAAADAADAAGLARAAHDLKGGSGNLGLVQVVELLARVEQLAREGQLAGIAAMLSELPAVHAAAIAAVRDELARCTSIPERHHA